LAEVFFRRGLIERWGTGTLKIIDLCRAAGHPEPEFEEQAGALYVRFIPSAYVPPDRISHDLTERQREILVVLSSAAKLRSGEIAARLKETLSAATLRRELTLLRELGLIESQGRGRGAVWLLQTSRISSTMGSE
jgi:ATP-dependent DNA helicase RecG